MSHPNAFASAVTSGLAALLVWLLASHGVHLSAPESSLIAGAIGSAVLFVGRRGLKGAARGIWSGFGTAIKGSQGTRTKR